MINLSLLISKYAWVVVIVGVIAWVTYMALKKPNKDNPEKLSRLGLAIEKAKPIYANFQKNVAETYTPKETKAEQPKVIDAEVVVDKPTTKEVKKDEFETKPDSINAMFKPIDFTF
jgi:hypothetical protein